MTSSSSTDRPAPDAGGELDPDSTPPLTRSGPDRQGGVQSVARALELLEILADAGSDVTISDLAARSELPLPTIHRLLRTLVGLGYARHLPSRRYALGARLIKLGERAQTQLGAVAVPILHGLADSLGETANLAALDRDAVVYIAQAPSRHAMRMFTEVGRRVHLHNTGVGKAILASLPDATVTAMVQRSGMPTPTPHSHATAEALLDDIRVVRDRGYAVDEQETELGVRCYAVLIEGAPTPMAVSVSGPMARVDTAFGERAVAELRTASQTIAALLTAQE